LQAADLKGLSSAKQFLFFILISDTIGWTSRNDRQAIPEKPLRKTSVPE
jgi:hypothetical protein